ncbi:MAG: FkbM family methyltransferase [Acidobacteriota bacterium]|nr:FkbM family methyltransferase [Acidobacteriota bacterium]
MRNVRRRALVTLLVALPLAAIGAYAWHAGPFSLRYIADTRSFLFALKQGGHAPGVSWPALARRMGPRWMQTDEPTFVRASNAGDAPCPVLWQTPLGAFWGAREDGRVLDHLMMEELGGRIYDRAPAGLASGDIVIDVGAHLGTFTRYALLRGASLVIAVEPMPAIADCLERTFADEIAAGRVIVARAAAWRENRQLTFLAGSQSTTGRVADGPSALQVRGATLDTIAEEAGVSRVDFIKMDIEGAEMEALAGAAGLLRTHSPRMAICIYHEPGHARDVPALVAATQPAYTVFYRTAFQAYFHR